MPRSSPITVPQYLTGYASVMFTFDDHDVSIYNTVFPLFETYNARGSFYVITANIGAGPTYCTWDNLTEMQAAGWSIGNHTRDHTHLTAVSQADAQTAIANGMADLQAHSMAAYKHLSYPYGEYNAAVKAAAAAAGTLTGRTIDGGQWTQLGAGTDLFALPIARGMDVSYTLEQYIGDVDVSITQKKICVFVIHTVGTPGNISAADLESLLQYITARYVPIITIEDLYAAMSGSISVPIGA